MSIADLTLPLLLCYGEAEGHICLHTYNNVCPLKSTFVFALMYYSANCHNSFFQLDMWARQGSGKPPWEFEPVTFPSLAHFPNHYTLLLQALNGALRRVYTLRLGTLQREGVPRPINHTRPCGGNEGNGFGGSRWSGQSVRHVDGWVMGFCRRKSNKMLYTNYVKN